MTTRLVSALMPLARHFEAERAHRLALWVVRAGLLGRERAINDPILATQVCGLSLSNPVGLAAGFDKDAEAIGRLEGLGFGFIEAGTVTPRPQPGNPHPRLFRLPEDEAIINRMGFNNRGLAQYQARLASHRQRTVPIGANIGINKENAAPESDYPAMVAALATCADYIVINVSSPNTPGLRDLQNEQRLAIILTAIAQAVPEHPPLLVKLAPDLARESLGPIVETCVAHSVKGLIISNTTTARPAYLRSPASREPGGLSGRPLFAASTGMLARAFQLSRGRLCLIGVGGVFSGHDALLKIKAGAAAVQLYTALVYKGPAIVQRIKTQLATLLRDQGFRNVQDAIGVCARAMEEAG